MSRLHANAHREICECEEEQMCDPITGCNRYVRFVRRKGYAEEGSTWWESRLEHCELRWMRRGRETLTWADHAPSLVIQSP